MAASRRARPRPERLLTEFELEVMTVLWRLGEATVAQVQGELPRQPVAYTSVSTMVRILEQKGFVRSRKEGRLHVYAPRVPRQEYEAVALRHVIGKLFGGAPVNLVRALVEAEELSAGEIAELKALLKEKRR
ncbi:MAG TPA: BlaI/MecI/CopY family transcriptional regulator [Vicinamibacteria bacterium]